MTGFFLKTKRHEKIFVAAMVLFFGLFYLFQNLNNRFQLNDFRVYYSAAESFTHGGDIYGKAFGLSSGFYKYSPAALLFFVPASILPYWLAGTIHFFILGAAIVISVIGATHIMRSFYPGLSERQISFVPYMISIIGITHIYRELHLGNINALLIMLSLLTLQLSRKRKDVPAGLLLTLMILLKPHFLILGFIYLLRGRYKLMFITITSLFLGLLIPALFSGINHNIDLHRQWLHTMLAHNDSPTTGSNTIYFALLQIISQLGHFSPSRVFPYAVLASVLILISFFILRNKLLDVNSQQPFHQGLIFEFILVTALIPGLTVTDTEHFMFSFPLIAYLILYLFSVRGDYLRKVLIIISFFFYGGNIYEVVGRTLSDQMAAIGVLGTGNILMIIVGYSIFNSFHRNIETIGLQSGWIKTGRPKTTASLQGQS